MSFYGTRGWEWELRSRPGSKENKLTCAWINVYVKMLRIKVCMKKVFIGKQWEITESLEENILM